MKLLWTNYKSQHGSLSVWFPGGFQLYVNCEDDNWRPTKQWRVWWARNEHPATPEMRKLYLARFKTRAAAQKAAEAMFVPMALLAAELVAIPEAHRNPTPSASGAFRKQPKKRTRGEMAR